MNNMKQHKDFGKTANIIANAIRKLDADYRGNALLLAGEILKQNSQHTTGQLLISAANTYGVSPDEK